MLVDIYDGINYSKIMACGTKCDKIATILSKIVSLGRAICVRTTPTFAGLIQAGGRCGKREGGNTRAKWSTGPEVPASNRSAHLWECSPLFV